MSVVAALVVGNEVHMAADSACASLDHRWVREDATPKIWEQGPFVIGVVGTCRVSDIVSALDISSDTTPEQFIDLVRGALRKSGALKTKDGIETMEADMLVGWQGSLLHIVSNFGLFVPNGRYHAIGCGAEYALGSLHTSAQVGIPAYAQLEMAVNAAATFSPFVVAPFQVVPQRSKQVA